MHPCSFCWSRPLSAGNDVLMVEDLAKSFGSLQLFSHISMDIKRGKRLRSSAIMVPEKTTILKIINGLVPADSGTIRLGAKVHIGYYDQEHQLLSQEKTIFEEISDAYPSLDNTRIRSVLAAFLFTGDDVFKCISELSGGERGRVSLAKLMLSDANFLILDEPTNHLDMVSKEILEDAVRNYTGTVLYVSHDRYFINTTATRILDLTEGGLKNYPGNYDQYLEKQANPVTSGTGGGFDKQRGSQTPDALKASSGQTSESNAKADYQRQKEEAARLRKRQNDIAKIEKRIDDIEQRIAELDALLSDEQVYTNVSRLMEINDEKSALDEELLELMEKWEALESE